MPSIWLYSKLLDHITKSTSLTKAEVALYAAGILVSVAAWTLTTTTSGWLYAVCFAIGVTVSSLAGLLAIGLGVQQIIWTIHHGPASAFWPWPDEKE